MTATNPFKYNANNSNNPYKQHFNSKDAYKAALKDVVQVEGKPLPSPDLPHLPLSRSRTQDEFYELSKPESQQHQSSKLSRSNTTNNSSTQNINSHNKHFKKPGRHFDVIDSWDVTAVTGSALWHHDSPYDAVSPSRNAHTHKAPMKAFNEAPVNDSITNALSDEEREKRLREEKKQRNPLLEVWGKHEEEPWEAFSANAPIKRPSAVNDYQESPLLPPKPIRKPSSRIPPPKPIKIDDIVDLDKPIQIDSNSRRHSSIGTSEPIKRSQSILKRWKSTRKASQSKVNSSSSDDKSPSISPSPSNIEKSLPSPPKTNNADDSQSSPSKENTNVDQPLLCRKRSLMDKVKSGIGRGVRSRSKDTKQPILN